MSRYLSRSTHLVKIGADIVVLDTRTKDYFCLPAAAAAVRIGPDGVTFDDPDLGETFAQAGLLADAPTLEPMAPEMNLPAQDLGLRLAERLRLGDALLILAAWMTMVFSYHLVRFDRIVASTRRRSRLRAGGELGEDLKDLVAAFERMLPWLPFQGVCLYRSYLLLRVLRWRGHDAHWVFGVRTWPFLAHCWLQIGDVALDDTADRLEGFTPIMVV